MTMASLNKSALGSDDEDDLELLRLAALNSLKPKTTFETQSKPPGNSHCKPQHSYNKSSTFGAAQTTRHHNRGFRNNPGRMGRNGINPRVRTNTNLISIQTIDQDEPKEVIKDTPIDIPKLILPQDRYHKPLALEDTPKESSGNKFDRYDDNSEDSDSDSDEQAMKSSRRERKDSVELLMDELENEINLLDGKDEPNLKEEDKSLDSDEMNDKVSSEDTNTETDDKNKSEFDDAPTQNDTLIISETDPDLVQIDELSSPVKDAPPTILEISPPYKKSKSRSPYSHEKSHAQKRKSRTKSRSRSPFSSQYKSPYRSPKRSRSPARKVRYSPTHYPRALSPLTLNTEVLNTITMAPLSPRSAAFVLQNRQILARRQMSPRRSLSRESSCRRSLTPKRNKLSPRRRSRSPMKRSLSPRKRSLSPRQSPRRRSNSPRNNHHRRSPNYKSVKRSSKSPVVTNKQPIHKRLGSRPTSRNVSPYVDRKTEVPIAKRKRASRSISLSLSPSPDRNYHKRPLNETTGHVNNDVRNRREKQRKESPTQRPEQKTKEDPVLEARRRKFESPVQINNGIIKLRSNKTDEEYKEDGKTDDTEKVLSEESPEEKDFEDEVEVEENDEILDLNPTLDDLWSDDDSDDENEGRFKSKPSSEKKNVTILPFRKLTEKPVPKEPLLPRDDNDHRDRKYKRQRRRRSRSPLRSTNKSESKQKEPERDRVIVETKSKTAAEKVRAKPAEDEKRKEKTTVAVKSETNKNSDILKTLHSDKNVTRKVKIQKLPELPTGDSNVEISEEPEIIVENEDDVVTNKEDDGGDLRAELSRRRAQRLIKAGSLAEALPARLLKNALQEVVPKRSAIKQSKVTKGNGSSADRRVLILRRLASSPTPQLEPANKVVSKEGKLPIHMRLGSNPDVEEPVRERRSKRARMSRRKKQVQVPCLFLEYLQSLFTSDYCSLLLLYRSMQTFFRSIYDCETSMGINTLPLYLFRFYFYCLQPKISRNLFSSFVIRVQIYF